MPAGSALSAWSAKSPPAFRAPSSQYAYTLSSAESGTKARVPSVATPAASALAGSSAKPEPGTCRVGETWLAKLSHSGRLPVVRVGVLVPRPANESAATSNETCSPRTALRSGSRAGSTIRSNSYGIRSEPSSAVTATRNVPGTVGAPENVPTVREADAALANSSHGGRAPPAYDAERAGVAVASPVNADDGTSNENRSPAAARLSASMGAAAPIPEGVALETAISNVSDSEFWPSEADTASVWLPRPGGVPESVTVFSASLYAYILSPAESATNRRVPSEAAAAGPALSASSAKSPPAFRAPSRPCACTLPSAYTTNRPVPSEAMPAGVFAESVSKSPLIREPSMLYEYTLSSSESSTNTCAPCMAAPAACAFAASSETSLSASREPPAP